MTLITILAALVAASPSGALLFTEAPDALGSQPCADTKPGCYSHYVIAVDVDADGALDLLFANGGGYYEPGQVAPLAVYLGDGRGGLTEVGASALQGFEGRVRQIAAGDVDGDGDVDLYPPDAYGLQPDALFINDGASPPSFSEQGGWRVGRSSRAGAARMADLDRDGDLDLVVSDWGDAPPTSAGTAVVLLNDGTGRFTEAAGAVPQNTSAVGTGPVDLDLFDADGDFDLDLLLASRSGDSLLFFNDGRGRFTFVDEALPGQPGPYVYGPAVCDVDGDGDLDLWLDNGGAGRRAQLLINGGDGSYTDQTDARLPRAQNSRDDDNRVQCVDLDHDGDFDAVIASLSGNERALINDGAGDFHLRPGAFPKVSDASLGIDLGDLDGDGRLDAVTAQGESGSYLNRVYLGTGGQQVDHQPPVFRLIEGQGRANPSGGYTLAVAVADGALGDAGANILRVFSVDGLGVEREARFIGGDLYQLRFDSLAEVAQLARFCALDRQQNLRCVDR